MLSAGGHVPVHTVAPASASALAMANPYPPSSATPATRARLPRRSMLSIHPPLHEKPRRHRNQLRMFQQCVREDAAERALALRDPVHGAREGVEEVVIQALERLLDAIVLEVVLSQQLHPGAVIGSQTLPASVAFPIRSGGGAGWRGR